MKNKIKRFLIFFSLTASTLSIFASQPVFASTDAFSGRINTIISEAERGDEKIGVYIVSLSKGDSIYGHNNKVPLNPASCTKVITTTAALKLLGPDYRFHTEFFTNVRPVGGRVSALWVKGYGDPSIVIERLWRIARDLANAGLRQIDGDIIIDDYYFDGYNYPGYIKGSGRAYNSLTGAVSLNYNAITIIVSPSSQVGSSPYVALDTAGPYFRVINTAKTGPRGSKLSLAVARQEQNGEDVIQVTGSIPVESPPQYLYRNITNPPIYFGLALKSLLEQNGIKVAGKVRHEMAPRGGYMLLDSISEPLSLIIRDMNKFSNNFVAEQLVKTLGAYVAGPPGSTKNGIRVIENFLGEIGVDPNEYKLVNGSGLTLENKITATAMIKVLSNSFSDFRIAPEIMSSFSIAGVDGTTKSRHTSEKVKGLARAKTGTLNGVSTLVGTIPSMNGEILGYAILMNGNSIDWLSSHQIQESMLNAMASFTR